MDRFVIKRPKTSNESTSAEAECSTNQQNQNLFHHPQEISSLLTHEDTQSESDHTKSIISTSSSENDCDSHDLIESKPVNRHTKRKKSYKQKYCAKWAEEYDFIEQTKEGETSCKICSVKIKGNLFHVKRHVSSILHIKKYNAQKNTPAIDSNLKKKFVGFEEKTKLLEHKLVVFLCDNNLPLSLMNELEKLMKDLFPENEIIKHLHLQRQKATNIIFQELGPFSKELIINKLRVEKFSIIIDETTDVGTKKSLVLVARYFDSDSHTVKDHFVDLIEVTDATAASLFNCIKNILLTNNIPFQNVIGFGADNASVMMGNTNGVKAKLKEICPNIVVQGCGSHSLHLCASAAAKKLPNSVEQFVRDIYTFFCHSSKISEELKEFQVFVNEKTTKMLYPSQTRWLSLKQVCSRILKHWVSLTLYFQKAALEAELPAARTIFGALKNPIFLLYIQFLDFNLSQIIELNLELQAEGPKVTVMLQRITNLYTSILKCFIKQEVIKNTEIHEINVCHPHNYKKLDDIYFGGNVDVFLNNPSELSKVDKNDLHNFKLRCLDFYKEISVQIKKRFNFQDQHLQYASLFSPCVALSGDVFPISQYKILFPEIDANIDLVNREWQSLPDYGIFKNCDRTPIDACTFWSKVDKARNELNKPMFSNLMKVVKYILALPHSSAAAERIFSQLSLIKTKLRNALNIKTCSCLLAIKENIRNGLILPPRNYKVYREMDADV